MILSDVSVKRPVLATVMSILLVTFGAISFTRLPLKELPSTEAAIISVSTTYPGASAEVVESRITKVIEQEIAGIAGIDHITANSQNERSSVSITFNLDRDIDGAASDVRDAMSRLGGRLPDEADVPRISKMDADAQAILWFAVSSTTLEPMKLAVYTQHFIVDRLSVIDGVAQIQGGNETEPAMHVWLDRVALTARNLTVSDVTRALRAENVELPGGSIESKERNFPIRIKRGYSTVEDFEQLVIGRGSDGHLIRLSEVARVDRSPKTEDLFFQGNGVPQLGIGVIKTSTANALDVAHKVWAELDAIRPSLPAGTTVEPTYDSTIFVEEAIYEVYRTLAIATLLVVFVIYAFLGSIRAALVPAAVVPVCVIATFGILGLFGYSINLMTLLGLVLCIGLVVDDSIVVLENVQRRVDLGEPPVLAAYRGTRQVAFAVLATTTVLVAVFTPLIFVQGFVGRIFGELGVTMAGAVIISGFCALSLSAMMCSKLLRRKRSETGEATNFAARFIDRVRAAYIRALERILPYPGLSALTLVVIVGAIVALWQLIPQELSPTEDRGVVNLNFTGAEGASYDVTLGQMKEIESKLLPLVGKGDIVRVTLRVPGGWGSEGTTNTGRGFVVLEDWNKRDSSGDDLVRMVNGVVGGVPGVRAIVGMNQGMAGMWGPPVSLVVSGPSYDTVEEWTDLIIDRARQNPGLTRIDTDYKPTKPQFLVVPNYTRAADLGVSVQAIGETLQAMMGKQQVTRFIENGEEYDVYVEGSEENREQPSDLTNLFVRSDRTGELIPMSNLVTVQEIADASSRKRWNQLQAITISAFLAPDYSLGEALNFLENVVNTELRGGPKIDYTGESRRYKEQGNALFFAFGMALLIVFLVLAAQFESFIHPFVIMLTVPVAIVGGLFGLWMLGSTVNIYSQIGLVILVGIAAKNGILIVEFANQLRDQGYEFVDALLKAAETRFRPIVMTGISTAMGAIPLVFARGPGAGSRLTIGIVIVVGTLFSTLMTLFIVPVFYRLLARHTGSPGLIARKLAEFEAGEGPRARPSALPAE